MADTPSNTPESTLVPDKRDESTDTPVTTLATVDANTSLTDMKNMSGATDKDASDQQKDALEGLKQAKAVAKDPSKQPEPNPFAMGPGSDIA